MSLGRLGQIHQQLTNGQMGHKQMVPLRTHGCLLVTITQLARNGKVRSYHDHPMVNSEEITHSRGYLDFIRRHQFEYH